MRNGGYKWFRIFLYGLFCVGVTAVLAVSLPQMLLHFYDAGYQDRCGEKVSLSKILEKNRLSSNDYQIIFEQTGLGRQAVESLRDRQGYQKDEIQAFQTAIFSKIKIECRATSPITRQDRCCSAEGKKLPIAPIEDGDILISFSSHTFGWRHGHAGIVVDAQEGLCLEALTLGSESELKDLDHWREYSNFAVLRLKNTDAQERKVIAQYARDCLNGVPYSLLSGLHGKKEAVSNCCGQAQCAYLIWYAFAHFGYDLDSDGGRIVTVADLAASSLLDVVQSFHISPEAFYRFEDDKRSKSVKIGE